MTNKDPTVIYFLPQLLQDYSASDRLTITLHTISFQMPKPSQSGMGLAASVA